MRGNKGFYGVAVMCALGCVFAPRAFATATTHIWAPSTDVQAFKKVHLTSDFYFSAERDGAGNRPATVTNLGLTVGVLSFKKLNAEAGFDHKTGYGDLDDFPMYFNFKIGVPEEAYGKYFPAFAIGVYDIGTEKNKTDDDVFYGKVAKCFKYRKTDLGRLSVGYFAGNKKLLLGKDGGKDNSGVLVAWERTVPEISDKLWVCLEYQGSSSLYGCFTPGFSWKVADNASVLFGYQIYNNHSLANTATVQVDIDF
jgi:hypothetical protein